MVDAAAEKLDAIADWMASCVAKEHVHQMSRLGGRYIAEIVVFEVAEQVGTGWKKSVGMKAPQLSVGIRKSSVEQTAVVKDTEVEWPVRSIEGLLMVEKDIVEGMLGGHNDDWKTAEQFEYGPKMDEPSMAH